MMSTWADLPVVGQISSILRRDRPFRGNLRHQTRVRAKANFAKPFKRVGAFPDDIGTDEDVGLRMQMVFGPMLDVGLSQVSLGDVFKGIVQMMESYDVPSPQELVLVTKQLLYFERYAKVHAPNWAMARDLFLVKNIFPEAVAAKEQLIDLGEESRSQTQRYSTRSY